MKTIHGKFFLVVAALVLGIGALAFYVQGRTFRHDLTAITQVLNEALAEHLVAQYFQKASPAPESASAVRSEFSRLMDANPNIELYLLDDSGRIELFTAPAKEVLRQRIGLQPIRDFIARDFTIPVYGDDPKDANGTKIFSAAPLDPDHPEAGYLYVILRWGGI